jgi:flagellar M-ring protein FliF
MPGDLATRTLQSGSTVTPEMLNQLIRQKPANIGTALRDWVGAPGTKN